MDSSLKIFLQPTEFCDCNNKKIQYFSHELTKQYNLELDKAKCLFDYIKNHYKYSFGNWKLKASEVIDKKVGMCTTKTNLLVACLRSLNIPARFHVIRINAKDIFNFFNRSFFFRNKISDNSIHIFAEVFINGHWIKLDSSLDSDLMKGIEKLGYRHGLNEIWDGTHDYVNFIPENKILFDLGSSANIDEYHKKNRRVAKNIFIIFSNIFFTYFRLIGKFL